MSDNIINVCAVSYKNILNNITAAFRPGQIYGIIGPNGAGKTTLLRLILGFLRPDSGCITVNGKNVSIYKKTELARLISLVPQKTTLDTDFSVYDVVMTGRNPHQNMWGTVTRNDRIITDNAMEFTGITHIKDRPYILLSGGEAQRTIVSRSIAQASPWLLLDEPVASLDIKSQTVLTANLKKLHEKKGLSVIMVLHDINLAASCCDTILMMKEGKILCEGNSEEILCEARLKELYDMDFRTVIDETDGRKYFFPKL